METQDTKNILVMCTGNLFRSPIAEALIKQRLERIHPPLPVQLSSAGLVQSAIKYVPAEVVNFMQSRYNIDLSDHRPQMYSLPMIQKADLILLMEQRQIDHLARQAPRYARKMRLISECENRIYDIPDPAQNPSRDIIDVASRLHELIDQHFDILLSWINIELKKED